MAFIVAAGNFAGAGGHREELKMSKHERGTAAGVAKSTRSGIPGGGMSNHCVVIAVRYFRIGHECTSK